jgi:elongation factor Ts
MSVNAKVVKELRERTGAGFMDCKKALVECDGNLDKAAEFLQKKQLASAGKKASRIAAEGIIGSYIHAGGRIGVLLEVNCETDFVALNEDFQSFVKDVSMHIAAMNPLVVRSEELPADLIAKQKEIFLGQAMNEGKPAEIAEKIVVGRLNKWFREVSLVDQAFVKDSDKSVAKMETEITAKIGEKVSIRRFIRFEVGEGLEKRDEDFAAEVARQVGQA